MVYHLTLEEMAESARAAQSIRKRDYGLALDHLRTAIEMLPNPTGRFESPDDSYSLIAQQFMILEALLMKEVL